MGSFDVYLRLVVAVLLGAAIGFERQWHQGMAGIRTNALVALGSALFVTIATLTPSDPSATRIAAQVVVGIGFLGAGVIMRHGLSVTGLNTAATLWCASGVGAIAGQGYPIPAAGGALVVVLSNIVLRQISRRLELHGKTVATEPVHYAVRISCNAEDQDHVRARLITELSDSSMRLSGIQSSPMQSGRVEIRADLVCDGPSEDALHTLVAHLGTSKEIVGINWEVSREPLPLQNGGGPLG